MNIWTFIFLVILVFVIWDLVDSFMAYKFGVDKRSKTKKNEKK